MAKVCGTGNAHKNRAPLTFGAKIMTPRVFWALAGSGLSLRRGSNGWRADCPADPAHTLSIAYHKLDDLTDAGVFLRCWTPDASYQADGWEDGRACPTLAVLTALGCSWRDLYQQPLDAADGQCALCRAHGYRVSGVANGQPICLSHLLEQTGQPQKLLFAQSA